MARRLSEQADHTRGDAETHETQAGNKKTAAGAQLNPPRLLACRFSTGLTRSLQPAHLAQTSSALLTYSYEFARCLLLDWQYPRWIVCKLTAMDWAARHACSVRRLHGASWDHMR